MTIRTASILLLTSAAAAWAGACATQPAPVAQTAAAGGGRQCFFSGNVNDYDAVDDNKVRVSVGANTMYELQLASSCPDIDWHRQIALRSRTGSNWICSGLDAEIIVPSGPIGPQRCDVEDVRQLSAAEVAAVKAKAR